MNYKKVKVDEFIMDNYYSDIKYLSMWIGGYFGPINYVDFDFVESKVSYYYQEMLGAEAIETTSNFNKKSFLENLKRFNVLSWEEEYVDYNFCDGTQWSLDIVFHPKKTIKIVGSNAYPENYEKLCKIISQIVHKSFR